MLPPKLEARSEKAIAPKCSSLSVFCPCSLTGPSLKPSELGERLDYWKAFHVGHCLSGGSVTYTYDGDGQRAKKSNGKLYWYSISGDVLAESDSSGTITSEYIYFNGRRIARRDPATGNVYYYLPDHIGSARVVTNSTGGVAEQSDFYPFGTERVITDSLDNNYKFAGMERDTESALDHTLYRQYASNLARWPSPDPADATPSNPQSWNRYPYVLTDPLTLVDPLGATPQYDPYLVGCFPDPFFEALFGGFGCGWDASEPCPPGYEPIYGDPRSDRNCGPATATPPAALDYANIRFGPYSDFLSYQAGENGIDVTFGPELSELVRNGFIAIPIAIPIAIDILGPIIIRGLQIATISILAEMFRHILIIDVVCHLVGQNVPTMNSPKKECLYVCGDNASFRLLIPRLATCKDRIDKQIIVFGAWKRAPRLRQR